MVALLPLLALLAAQEAGFGGAPAPAAAAPTEEKEEEEAAVDDSPGQPELRAQMAAALRGSTGPEQQGAPAHQRTKLEEELAKARLDPTLPLLAFRIEVERAALEVDELIKAQARPEVVRAAEDRLAALREIGDLVERIALARLVQCTRGLGREIVVKNYRMTAGGPVPLTTNELLAQVPHGDPAGCERVTLMDAAVMAKVRRLFEVRAQLEVHTFGYHEVAARKALEAERDRLARELEQQSTPAPYLPSRRR